MEGIVTTFQIDILDSRNLKKLKKTNNNQHYDLMETRFMSNPKACDFGLLDVRFINS